MSRKKRSDSKLDSLPPHQKKMLRDWLVDENLSYEKARERLEQDFGIETSLNALSQFYATECFALRSSEAKSFAALVEKELLTTEPTFDQATLALVKQKAFERAYAKTGDVDELATLAGIIADSQRLALKERELAISSQALALKVKQYEDKISTARTSLEKARSKGGINAETLKLIEEQLKLL